MSVEKLFFLSIWTLRLNNSHFQQTYHLWSKNENNMKKEFNGDLFGSLSK